MPAISRPRKRTSPMVGRSRPVTTLTSVVLPAPFGPTIETNSPSLTRNETFLSALNTPNDFETLMVSNRGALSAAWPGCISSPSIAPVDDGLDGPGQALRHEHHEEHQHATHDKAPVLRDGHHEILQYDEDQCADRRARKRATAAENRHEDEVARVGPVRQFGIGQSRRDGQNGSADTAINSGNHEGGQPHPENLYADIGGLAGVLAYRAQMQTKRRLGYSPHRQT